MEKYVQIISSGALHIKVEGKKRTICGRDYAHLDYLPVSEDEYNPNYQNVCHKCQNKRREGPRTIKKAFTPERVLG